MAKKLTINNGYVSESFVYEGENLGLQYPDGTIIPIPSSKTILCLMDGVLQENKHPCKIVLPLSPITRLPIVEIPKEKSK